MAKPNPSAIFVITTIASLTRKPMGGSDLATLNSLSFGGRALRICRNVLASTLASVVATVALALTLVAWLVRD